jgi:ribonuclease J
MPAVTSTSAQVRIVVLGGLGEIGLNLMAIECAGRAILIDCGLMFSDEPALGGGVYAPEMTWLEQSRITVDAVVLTHAHEDHIGAVPHLLRRINAPIYGTEVTLAFVRRGFREASFDVMPDLRPIAPRRAFSAGPFEVEPIRVTHSTPDSVALAIRTPAGIFVHSGDFKIDESPVDSEYFDRERFAELGAEGVALLLSDSTNVERAGRSGSESSIKPVIRDLARRTRGRFFLSAFSSHLHRIRQVAEVAHELGRHVVPLGRRMAESVRLGFETGQLAMPRGLFIEQGEADFLEPSKLAYLASGSQGEPMSALTRLAADSHPRVHIDEGDMVVLSSRFIPGNERAIHHVVNRLYKLGAEVIYEDIAPVHVSGHANQDELTELIKLVRPRNFIPIHGEYRHLARHLALAIAAGVPQRNCFLLEDGDSIAIRDGVLSRTRKEIAGRVAVDGGESGDPALMGERRVLARDGTVTAILVVSAKTGEIVSGPDLVSRGLVVGDGTSIHIRRASAELRQRLMRAGLPLRADEPRLKDEIIRSVKRYFSDELGKRPLVIPYVTEI